LSRPRTLATAGLAGALVALVAVAPAAAAPAPPEAEQRWIVTLDEGSTIEGTDLPDDVVVEGAFDDIGAAAVGATATEAAELRRDPSVESVEPVRELELVLDDSGPALGVPVAVAQGLDGHGRQVAVVDTGVDASHPTFAGAMAAEACFAPSGTLCPGGAAEANGPGSAVPPCTTAACLHGSHVAAIAVGRGGGGVSQGVARGAGLVAVRIFGMRSGRLVADTASLLAGLDHVIGLRQGGAPIDVVNLSLASSGSGLFGGHCDSSPSVSAATRTAIGLLTSLGVLVVVASGNQGSSTGVAEPACFANAYAVGASDLGRPERVTSFTNSGPALDLLAPGLAIRSAGASGGALTSSGTSAAAPFVAGAVAALRSGSPSLPVSRVRSVLADSGVLVDDPARGRFLRLDVAATVLSLGDGIGVGSAGASSHLRNSPTAGRPTRTFGFGTASDRLLVGDWNGDGIDTYGVRRGATVILTNNPAGGAGQLTFNYGFPSDQVVVGDWDGDGRDSIGIRRGGTFHLRNALSAGPGEVSFAFGVATDRVVVGDWDGNGADSIGLRRSAGFLLRNALSGGPAEVQFGYGLATDVPVVGDWTGEGRDTVGVRRGNQWLLRTTNTAGSAELSFAFGSATAPPIVGDWDGT
jgi:Subtilase family